MACHDHHASDSPHIRLLNPSRCTAKIITGSVPTACPPLLPLHSYDQRVTGLPSPLAQIITIHCPITCSLTPFPPRCTAKIITGSFQGNLRIYKVKERDFKPEDLLLEQQLEGPILQVATGHFSS